jgi:hypothetical protein
MEEDHLIRDLLLELHATGRIASFDEPKTQKICQVLKEAGIIQPGTDEEWRLTPKGVALLTELM